MYDVQAHGYHGDYIGDTVTTPDMTSAAMLAAQMLRDYSAAYIVEVWDGDEQVAYFGSEDEANAAAVAALTA